MRGSRAVRKPQPIEPISVAGDLTRDDAQRRASPRTMSRISVDGLGSHLSRLTTDSQAGMNADGIPPVM